MSAPTNKHNCLIVDIVRLMSDGTEAGFTAGELLDRLEESGADWFDRRRQPRPVRARRLAAILWREQRQVLPRIARARRGRYRVAGPLTLTVALDEGALRQMLRGNGPVMLPSAYGEAVQVEARLVLDRERALRVLIDAAQDLRSRPSPPNSRTFRRRVGRAPAIAGGGKCT